ncbi:hypothetical protein CEXT_364131 [Caerostris extrusa]|uniref:Uncharacterized protein n=1 Tax=Caerostris extrusa TaxID=172846 RepID=A0AAV4QKN0_CAEEX|nr:hypothetical protein CEXT_364131 [Caerostris extrusa]
MPGISLASRSGEDVEVFSNMPTLPFRPTKQMTTNSSTRCRSKLQWHNLHLYHYQNSKKDHLSPGHRGTTKPHTLRLVGHISRAKREEFQQFRFHRASKRNAVSDISRQLRDRSPEPKIETKRAPCTPVEWFRKQVVNEQEFTDGFSRLEPLISPAFQQFGNCATPFNISIMRLNRGAIINLLPSGTSCGGAHQVTNEIQGNYKATWGALGFLGTWLKLHC